MLREALEKRTNQARRRVLAIENRLIDFASNDYLGLARSDSMGQAVLAKWDELRCVYPKMSGFGSTGSRLLTGNLSYAQELEAKIAAFHGFESGLLFATGYMANMGLLSAVAKREDHVLYDAHIHASTRDGISISHACSYFIRHNDLHHLERRLKNLPEIGNRFLCIESVYSTDGSFAPLLEIANLASHYHVKLIVDEAHAAGVFGPQGRGLVAEHQLQDVVFAQITTFGKALGCQGAIVLGSELLKEYLINFCKTCIYSTALPLAALAAIECAYAIFPTLEQERAELQSHISKVQKSTSPIQPVKAKMLLQAVNTFASSGFDVRAIRSPTVRSKDEHLRIALHAFNTNDEVMALLACIRDMEAKDV